MANVTNLESETTASNNFMDVEKILTDSEYVRTSAVDWLAANQVQQLTHGIPKWCDTYRFMIYAVIIGTICVLGLIGNCVVQFTLWPEVKTNTTSFLLITLAAFDNIVLMVHFIAKSLEGAFYYFNAGEFFSSNIHPFTKTILWTIGHTAHMNSVYIIVLISFCRFIAVCKPHEMHKYTSIRNIWIATAAILIASIIYYIPRMFRINLYYDSSQNKFITKTHSYAKTTAFWVYDVPLNYIVLYLVPILLLIVMTAYQIKGLRASKKRLEEMTKSKREETDVTITLIIVVVVFMVCQIWEPLRRLVNELNPDADSSDCRLFRYHTVSLKTFFASFNSAVNFFIYCIVGKKFRKQFVRRVLRNNKVYSGSTVASQANIWKTQSQQL